MAVLPSEGLIGRHALVTGAGRGIGRATALDLAEQGATLTLVSRTESDLDSLAAEIRSAGGEVRMRPTDVADAAALETTILAAHSDQPLSILVTAAGLNRTGPSTTYPLSDWDLLMDVNVRGTFAACRAAGACMIEAGKGGRVITLSSQMGAVGYPGRAAYCATKHAVNGLTKALAVEWAPFGVTVNAVAPTFVDTPLTRPMLEDSDFAAEVSRRIPGGEIATVEDVASAIAFLASDRARSITGHVLAVDRGWTAW